MRATVMYAAHDVRVETVPDARLVEGGIDRQNNSCGRTAMTGTITRAR